MKIITEKDFNTWLVGFLSQTFPSDNERFETESCKKVVTAANEITDFINKHGVYETTEVEKLQELISYLKKELEKK